MAKTNRERIGSALEALSDGLAPFVEAELRAWVKRQGQGNPDDWFDLAVHAMTPPGKTPYEYSPADVQFQLRAMQVLWDGVFRDVLAKEHRSYANELLTVRNAWAHQDPFSTDDTYRAFDTMERLLTAVSAGEAAEIARRKHDLMRVRYEEQTKKTAKAVGDLLVEGKPAGGAVPWREVIAPHDDVATGRYSQAEFAADLAQVHRGEGSSEYRDPREFFRRTYMTDGLRRLLRGAAARLDGMGGAPIIELQTNFGGGKTHSLLALYHMFSGAEATGLAGVEALLADAAVDLPAEDVRRAVLVGTWLSPAQTHRPDGGPEIHTLWGELAWQVGGQAAYDSIAEADRTGTSPGAAAIRSLLGDGPTLILIDEWVAYARMLWGKDDLPGGTFDSHFTFAQSLTEAARAAPRTLLVVSIPASAGPSGPAGETIGSEIEIGGEGGRQALKRLKNVIGRIESPWQPATAEESFEIVRRRLFKDLAGTDAHTRRDATARAFVEFYKANEGEFPAGTKEASYEDRIKAAYPIHPELFDRLYGDWSSLERFQRTRGVLRLMAGVIHQLWESGDQSPLIMPASVPIAAPTVQEELNNYLEENWPPVIETDVDGPNSTPRRLDAEYPNLGKYQACRRVARTIFLGSAPTLKSENRGINDRRIKLGSALPGESPATYGDALRRLTDSATHIYVDESGRYWFATQPSVAQLARDRAEQFDTDEHVYTEILSRLDATKGKAGFPALQIDRGTSGDIPDEQQVRLVVLGPEKPHSSKTADSAAITRARELLDERGSSPRRFRNMLVFAAADASRLEELEQAVRQQLAWASISSDRETLNLDQFGIKQTEAKLEQARDTVSQRLPDTYQWLLVPVQPDPTGGIEIETIRIRGSEPIPERAFRKLTGDGLLVTDYGATNLRLDLDRVPLWRNDDVSVRQLWEDFAQYPYLQRLCDFDVLRRSIASGLASTSWNIDTFAYAESRDDEAGRYRGLQAGSHKATVTLEGLLVKADFALAQQKAESADVAVEPEPAGAGATAQTPTVVGEDEEAPAVYRRFHGRVELDPLRLGTKAGDIAEFITAQLAKAGASRLCVHIEIEAEADAGFDEATIRKVTENAANLKFETHGFEER
ncbi:MAG: DUF499 domain-containing protein [Acidimicrobiia bacterium]|nr:DUF499 domain-containing protein [Acidimicrobiia bacterium]